MASSRSRRPLASTASCALPSSSFEHALDARTVLGDRIADLHLHDRVAAVEIAAHLGTQLLDALAGIVVATRRIDEDARVGLALVALGEQAEQRLAGDLCHGVPDRHVDRADRDRALAVSAGLLVLHHAQPRCDRGSRLSPASFVSVFGSASEPRREALADQAALTVAAVRVEAVADDRAAVAPHVGHDRDQRERHFGEIDIGVGDRRGDRRGHFADIDDAHASHSGGTSRT